MPVTMCIWNIFILKDDGLGRKIMKALTERARSVLFPRWTGNREIWPMNPPQKNGFQVKLPLWNGQIRV